MQTTITVPVNTPRGIQMKKLSLPVDKGILQSYSLPPDPTVLSSVGNSSSTPVPILKEYKSRTWEKQTLKFGTMSLRNWRAAAASTTTVTTVSTSPLTLQQAHQQAIEDMKNAKLRRSMGTKRTRRELDE